MRKKHLVVVFIVLVVLTSSLFAFTSNQREPKEPKMNIEQMITYNLVERIAVLAGLGEPDPPAGSNPSYIIRDTNGQNIFEVDHTHRSIIHGNLTINDTMIFNTSVTASCPRIYVNGSGCWLMEACDGSRIGQGAGC